MKIAGTIQDSIVDGPGFRYTVFTQGCPHDCPECHNPQTHDMNGGKEMSVSDIIEEMLSNPLTDGVTLSGGDPFVQPADCALIAEAAHKNKLNVWAYTGWEYEELLKMSEGDPDIMELLKRVDVLIDGRFMIEKKSLGCKWRGSTNQRLIDVRKSLASGSVVTLD